MGPPDSHGVPRAPRYSGYRPGGGGLRVRACHPLRGAFPDASARLPPRRRGGPTTPHAPRRGRFGLLPGRSPLLGESLLFSFPPGTKMFQFPGLASGLCRMAGLQPAGLPHSGVRGSKAACAYPRLFAACRALLRLPEPRHPPYALSCTGRPCTPKGCEEATAQLLHGAVTRFSSCSIMSMTDRTVCPDWVENNGFEPLTPCVQSRCSSQLS